MSGNLIATFRVAFIIIPIATAFAVFFILEEAENMAAERDYARAPAQAAENKESSKDEFSKG